MLDQTYAATSMINRPYNPKVTETKLSTPCAASELSKWIGAKAFARLADISRQMAWKALVRAFDGQCWHDHRLTVRRVRGRGGNSGWQYQVRVDSLPEELQKAVRANPVMVRSVEGHNLDVDDFSPVAQWRYEVIKEALKHPSRSVERADVVNRLASVSRTWPSGKHGVVGVRTLREWLHAYERAGIQGLRRRVRQDRGDDRVFISRAWDAAVPFDDATKARIRDATLRDVRSLWAENLSAGWGTIARLATSRLMEATRRDGFEADMRRLKAVCRLPRSFIEKGRAHHALAIHDKDRKQWFDKSMPRIFRTRDGRKPMEIVIGDVHHLGILLRRPDGSTYTPKLIAWHDWATNRIFAYPVFLQKGRMVRQEHVIEAYIAMIEDPGWGVPEVLYLDNGSEYIWAKLIDDAQRLNTDIRIIGDDDAMVVALKARRSSIVKARPYNAPAKTIEGVFGVLEGGFLSMIPGWIAGNRMAKKTANVGKKPAPYPGDEAAFRRDLELMLDAYETHPQSGVLGGKSPREAFAKAISEGWERMDAKADELRAIFAKDEERTVSQGSFSVNGTRYTAREIQRLPAGTRVWVRVPLFGGVSRLPVLNDDGSLLCIAERDVPFDALDAAGAREAAARVRENRRGLAEMRKNVDPVDMRERIRHLVTEEAPAPIPNSAGTIRVVGTMADIGTAMETSAPQTKAARADEYEREQAQFARNLDRLLETKRRANG